MSHFIEKCRMCGAVQAQCRCPSPEKVVRYVTCEKCRDKQLAEPVEIIQLRSGV